MKTALLFICSILSSFSYAQILDTNFGINGIANNHFSTSRSSDVILAAAIQPDGKIIYVGKGINENYSFIARHNNDGSYDTSFNTFGFRTSVGKGFNSVLIQNDGKILVGIVYDGYSDFDNVRRFNSDGSLDTTFGINGSVKIVESNSLFNTKSFSLQDDGKIVLNGINYSPYSGGNTAGNKIEVVRLNSNGSLDATFDTDGKKIIPIATFNDESYASIIQNDGKILVTGRSKYSSNQNSYDIITIRLNENGALDNTFGNNGISRFHSSTNSNGIARSITIQSDNKILIAGLQNSYLTILRYNVDGSLDTTFNTTGVYQCSLPINNPSVSTTNYSCIPIIKSLSNGKILASATINSDYALVELNSDGSSNLNFGTNGILMSNANDFDYSSFLLIRPNENIITGGGSNDIANINYTLEKKEFNSNGVFITSTTFSLTEGTDKVLKSVVQNDGKIISICEFHKDTSIFNVIRRQHTDGTIDTTFGANGQIQLNTTLSKLIVDTTGKIIAIDKVAPILYKFNSDGTPDVTFGINGLKNYNLDSANRILYIDELFVSTTNEIFIGFDYKTNVPNYIFDLSSFGLAKLNVDGTITTSFGINGIATLRFDYFGIYSNEWPTNICIQSDNKIVVAGKLNYEYYTGNPENSVVGITRFNSDGVLDTTFGNSGKIITQVNTKNYGTDMICLNNDQFLINIVDVNNSVTNTFTVKYNSDGNLDLNFGVNGILNDGYKSNSMIVQPDGKIIKSVSSSNQFSIKRYLSNGTIDLGFGNAGTLSTAVNYLGDCNTLLLTNDNKLLAGGSSFNGTNVEMTQAKYTDLNLDVVSPNNQNSFLFYPNPIQTEATFSYNLINNETVSIDIIDFQGKIVQSVLQNKPQTKGYHIQTINLSNRLAAGNYILKFYSSFGSKNIKIIKKD
ncbi:T9SS type A sorting domain-containing protein [Flavobacterium sp.]|uniref:T9SS type A sorting domain-containing protein n=1 Tax=Flavobacterium sp. TaxID=239 RepID=UPI002613CD76|nr:T9SS type A sorting domain-containing protein [Flavobacterium sp.]